MNYQIKSINYCKMLQGRAAGTRRRRSRSRPESTRSRCSSRVGTRGPSSAAARVARLAGAVALGAERESARRLLVTLNALEARAGDAAAARVLSRGQHWWRSLLRVVVDGLRRVARGRGGTRRRGTLAVLTSGTRAGARARNRTHRTRARADTTGAGARAQVRDADRRCTDLSDERL